MKNKQEVKLFEAFAGIGSQYKALKNIANKMNWTIKHVGMVEWFVDAIIGYVAIHGKNLNPKNESFDFNNVSLSSDSKNPISDISKSKFKNSLKSYYLNYSKNVFNNIFDIYNLNKSNFPKNIDIFTYSFPCQDLSVQGLQKGIDKELKTRSGLLWEIERVLIEIKNTFKDEEMPKYLLMENVKNLIGKKNIANFNLWKKQLENLGYISQTFLLDSSDFGSNQKRERVFLLSINKNFQNKTNFKFCTPKKCGKTHFLNEILNHSENGFLDFSKYEMTQYKKTPSGIIKKEIKNYTNFSSENNVYNINGIGPTLTASGAQSRIKIEVKENKYRYLSPRETYRYMGFDDNDFDKVKNTNLLSDSKIIYTAGNSIVVNVLEAIFKTLKFGDSNE